MEYLSDNKAHRALWKGVPISRTERYSFVTEYRRVLRFTGTIGHMHYLKLHHLVMIRSMHVLQVLTP